MKKSPILEAIDQICEEKHIAKESVLATIEAALAVAYRKDFADKKNQNIVAEFNAEDASSRIFDVKEVVEDELFAEYERQKEEAAQAKEQEETKSLAPSTTEPAVPPKATPEGGAEGDGTLSEEEEEKKRRYDPKSMIPFTEALTMKPDAKVGDIIKTELFPPEEYGRMAAQTAKQVIIQRLREAEREMTFNEFKGRVGEILTGTVQRIENRVVLIDLGHATAILPGSEQIERERYIPGQRVKVYVVSVNQTTRGPEIVVSRSHPEMVKKLFTQEVPEVASGAITLKGVAREAGSRTKIAVYTTEPNIDPVGSCVGQRGTRVQTVISELGGEKIDIIQYEDDQVRFIMNALSPAKVLSVQLHEEERRAIAEVKEDQLSFAIGRAGQNVRLAARLTGWKIDIVKEAADEEPGTKKEKKTQGSEQAAENVEVQETPSASPSQGGEAGEASDNTLPREEAGPTEETQASSDAEQNVAAKEPAMDVPSPLASGEVPAEPAETSEPSAEATAAPDAPAPAETTAAKEEEAPAA